MNVRFDVAAAANMASLQSGSDERAPLSPRRRCSRLISTPSGAHQHRETNDPALGALRLAPARLQALTSTCQPTDDRNLDCHRVDDELAPHVVDHTTASV
jgi:hypothetical protein